MVSDDWIRPSIEAYFALEVTFMVVFGVTVKWSSD